jgi:EcsC protein family
MITDSQSGAAAAGRDPLDAMPGSLWERVRDDPLRAPEHIALAASERFAPPAERWAAEWRSRRSPYELARIARRRHVSIARLEGALAGVGGAFAIAPDLAALAWIQGRMIFFIAAALGFDPRHPMRPAELLALQEIYPTPAEAKAGLDGVGRLMATSYVASRLEREKAIKSRLIKVVGGSVAKRTVFRIPLVSVPIFATQNARATASLGDRAIAYYGGSPAARDQPWREGSS